MEKLKTFFRNSLHKMAIIKAAVNILAINFFIIVLIGNENLFFFLSVYVYLIYQQIQNMFIDIKNKEQQRYNEIFLSTCKILTLYNDEVQRKLNYDILNDLSNLCDMRTATAIKRKFAQNNNEFLKITAEAQEIINTERFHRAPTKKELKKIEENQN